MKITQAMKHRNATYTKCLQIVLTTPEIAEAQKANSKLKHFFKRNTVLDKGLDVRLGDNTYIVCKDGKMIIPKTLQRRAMLWYQHYLQHPGHTRLEETMKATMYWKGKSFCRRPFRIVPYICTFFQYIRTFGAPD
jgi:hypothetical protein